MSPETQTRLARSAAVLSAAFGVATGTYALYEARRDRAAALSFDPAARYLARETMRIETARLGSQASFLAVTLLVLCFGRRQPTALSRIVGLCFVVGQSLITLNSIRMVMVRRTFARRFGKEW